MAACVSARVCVCVCVGARERRCVRDSSTLDCAGAFLCVCVCGARIAAGVSALVFRMSQSPMHSTACSHMCIFTVHTPALRRFQALEKAQRPQVKKYGRGKSHPDSQQECSQSFAAAPWSASAASRPITSEYPRPA